MKTVRLACSVAWFLILSASSAPADVKPIGLLGDNAVLQRDMQAPIWGTADPGEKVTVTLGKYQAEATADQDGRWIVKLGPMAAGGPFEMTVAGKNTVTFKNVMIGEVWLCAGHSNMGLSVSQAINGAQEAATADCPGIRQCGVPYVTADQPLRTVAGRWTVCTPRTAAGFSAAGFFFARDLQKALNNVPVGLIVSGDVAETLVPREALAADPALKPILDRWAAELAKWPERKPAYDAQIEAWKKAVTKARAEGKQPPSEPGAPPNPTYWRRPSGLYYGTIAPMMPYAIRGVITYVERPLSYEARALLPAVVTSWRNGWGQGDFPFLMCQPAAYRPAVAEPRESEFAEFREAQLLTVKKLPNTAAIVTIDIGDAVEIHPKNKQDVGKRLALAARALAYGEKIEYSGPVYDSLAVEDGKIRLRFTHVGGGLVVKGGEPLKQFAIAGEDKKFAWADARIDGDTIVVSSDKVSKPVAVRYAWSDNPEGCNLFNRDGLPAVSFRTDEWPISGSPRRN